MRYWRGLSMRTKKTSATSSSRPSWRRAALPLLTPTKVPWVNAEAVATCLAPLTMMPPSVSLTT